MIVADTNLVIHLFNDTEFTSVAQKILERDAHWILPKLWQEGYANVLAKLAQKENWPIDIVLENFNHTIKELQDFEYEVDNQKALRIAMEHRISVYDACFVSIAIDFGIPLVTADKEVIKKCPRFAIGFQDFLNH